MRLSIKVDTRDVQITLRDYARVAKMELSDALQKKMAMLVSGGKGVKGLYQEAHDQAPDVKAEILALPQQLGWRIKRKSGSAMKEIYRRMRYAGLIQSTGWFNIRYGHRRADGSVRLRSVSNPRGVIQESLTGDKPYISLTNTTPNAGQYAERTGYVKRALDNITADMKEYIDRKLREQSKRLFG